MESNMNKSILSWIMGISFVVATPVAMADRGDHYHDGHKYKLKQTQVKKHKKNQTSKFVKADKHKKHHHVKQHQPSKRHHHTKKQGWSFSVSNYSPYRQISHNHYYENNNYRSRGIHERQMNQKRRIRKGIRKNQLARFEVRQLRNQQRRIAHRLDYFESDGRLNRHERAKIHRMLDRASRNIREKRHNRYVRDRHFDSGEYNYF